MRWGKRDKSPALGNWQILLPEGWDKAGLVRMGAVVQDRIPRNLKQTVRP